MPLLTKSRIKYVFAGVGAVYLVLFVGYLVYAGVRASRPRGPSELAAHPERQDEILARQRAEQLRDRLGLSEEQTRRLAQIFAAQGAAGPGDGDFRGRWEGLQQQLAQVLTPEQQAQMMQGRGVPGGRPGAGPGGAPGAPGGGRPGGFMNPERMQSLVQKMTPEQRARFEQQMQRMQMRRQQGFGGRGFGGQRGGGFQQR